MKSYFSLCEKKRDGKDEQITKFVLFITTLLDLLNSQ